MTGALCMAKPISFSYDVKDEMLKRSYADTEHNELLFLTSCFLGGRTERRVFSLKTSHDAWAKHLHRIACDTYDFSFVLERTAAGRHYVLRQEHPDCSIRLQQDVLLNVMQRDASSLNRGERAAILCAAFLTVGSIGNPDNSYQLAFAPKRMAASVWLFSVLTSIGFEPLRIQRNGCDVLYTKQGQQIADFLLHAGAHQSLLQFESLRVEKDVQNRVNRMVNCDSANLNRQLDAAARQIDDIRLIERIVGFDALPDNLLDAAQARLAFPDFSLDELGSKLNPPLSKSGVRHRLRKLQQIADQIREQQT